MDINIVNSWIKMFFIILFSMLILRRILNIGYNKRVILIIFMQSILFSTIYTIIKFYTNTGMAILAVYVLISCCIKILNKYKITYSMLSVLVSMALCLLSFGVAVAISFVLYTFLNIENDIIINLLIAFIQSLFIFLFFKIKRFRNGFDFLKNQNIYIDIIITNISTIIIFVYYLIGNYYHKTATNMFILFSFLGLFMITMIQEAFSMQYKQNLINKTIEEYKKEIKEKDQKIQELSNEKFNISKLNHEFYNRQMALELKVKELVSEAGEEIGILDRINNLTKEYSDNLQNLRSMPKLQLTDITEIDDMFKYMQEECYKSNIDFKLQIEGNIYYLINNIISKNKLETLIGDHIKDAIIAINSSNNKYKSIFVILGIKNNHYELCVYDTGKEFDIEVLLKLGLEPITSHRETGGSGIGFITTFETLKECKASLIIEEYNLDTTDYTKSVIIRFDNRNEYKIRTYRAEEIRKRSKDNRIIIENI